jgi:hypothetical protein
MLVWKEDCYLPGMWARMFGTAGISVTSSMDFKLQFRLHKYLRVAVIIEMCMG